MTTKQPAVVIVQGAWQTIEHYEDLISKLRSAGFLVGFPAFPTCNNAIPANKGLKDDVAAVRSTITKLADAGHPIMALMHSYGGSVINDAVPGLFWGDSTRPGGVVHLAYMAAFVVPVGNSVCSPFGGAIPPWLNEDMANALVWPKDPKLLCFSDLSDAAQEKWWSKAVACPSKPIQTPVENPPGAAKAVGGKIECTYLVCRLDPYLTTEIQEGLAKALGVDTRLEYVDAAHCAQIGAPDRIVEIIQGVWEIARKGVVEAEDS